MYGNFSLTKAIHEQRVRELIKDARPFDYQSLFARLRSRITALLERRADPKPVYSATASKSVEQTS